MKERWRVTCNEYDFPFHLPILLDKPPLRKNTMILICSSTPCIDEYLMHEGCIQRNIIENLTKHGAAPYWLKESRNNISKFLIPERIQEELWIKEII